MNQGSLNFDERAERNNAEAKRLRERPERPHDPEADIFGPDRIGEKVVEHVKKPVKEENPILKRETDFRHRTRDLYEKQGFIVADVGTWRQFWKDGTNNIRRSDLFGCIDSMAMKGTRWIGIQFTSKSHLGDHITKMCSHTPVGKHDATWRATRMRNWLNAGGEIHVVGWYKEGRFWKPEIRQLTLEILDTHEPRTRKKKAQ